MRVGIISLSDTDSAFDLGRDLQKIGVDINIYLSRKHVVRALDSPDGPVERIYEKGILPPDCSLKLFSFPRMRDLRSIETVLEICRVMVADKIDVVNILMGPAEPWLAVLPYFIKKPVVSTLIVPEPNIGDDLRNWVIPLHRLLIHRSNMLIVNGIEQISLVHRLYHTPVDRVRFVRLSARKTAFKWALHRQNEKAGTVLLFGRIEQQKGLEYLLKAQPLINEKIPNAKIIVAGHGENLDFYRQLIQDPTKVDFTEGYFSGEIMADYFEQASVVALPYISASTSGVLLTAYEFGKPVVATMVGCLPEYVQDGVTGLLIPPADIDQLAAAIVRVLSDDTLRSTMGKNAKRWIENENSKIAQQTVHVYEEAILDYQGKKPRKHRVDLWSKE